MTMAPLVFVTGASSGIGQAHGGCVSHRAGYRLALVARRTAEVQAWLQAEGIDACGGLVGGLRGRRARHRGDRGRGGRDCIAAQGVPDVVIANAGISVGIDTAVASDLEVMRATFETNNLGVAATFHPFIAPMRTRGSGRLVGIGSVGGIRGMPGHGAYCSSKAAVISYCESLRGELRDSGVRVVTLVPGYIDTPLTRANRYAMPF